jgi:hypothetical protein
MKGTIEEAFAFRRDIQGYEARRHQSGEGAAQAARRGRRRSSRAGKPSSACSRTGDYGDLSPLGVRPPRSSAELSRRRPTSNRHGINRTGPIKKLSSWTMPRRMTQKPCSKRWRDSIRGFVSSAGGRIVAWPLRETECWPRPEQRVWLSSMTMTKAARGDGASCSGRAPSKRLLLPSTSVQACPSLQAVPPSRSMRL